MNSLDIVKKIYPFPYSITGQGNDEAIPAFLSELPFTIHEYKSGQSLNGWHIPHAWKVSKATIYQKGELIYDAAISPLGVGVLSPSFSGQLELSTLKEHLCFDKNIPDATLYHWKNLYRPLEKDWAICMPYEKVEQLKPGLYDVELSTSESPSTMKVFDFFLQGESNKTILINGHNCHPFQANDDISGCAVGISVMQELMKRPKRKFSYRLIIAPELHGPMFWLKACPESITNDIQACILLKSVGNHANLKLQKSYLGNTEIDHIAKQAFAARYNNFEQGEFRAIYGNDETVFESPPYNIPTISLTRWPFKEYHTDLDTPEKISEQHIDDTEELVLDIIDRFEARKTYTRLFTGLVCLSSYNLYKSVPSVSESGVDYASEMGRWNRLMNCLPREIDMKLTAEDLAKKYQLPLCEIQSYLDEWVEAGLLKEDDV